MKTFIRSLPLSLLVLLFTYAALSKLMAFQEFRGQMHNQPFPKEAADAIVFLLPVSELLTVALMLFRRTERAGLLLSLVLLALFTGYIALVLSGFWNTVPCSCGGILGRMGWRAHLTFNLFFLTLNLRALYSHSRDEEELTAG